MFRCSGATLKLALPLCWLLLDSACTDPVFYPEPDAGRDAASEPPTLPPTKPDASPASEGDCDATLCRDDAGNSAPSDGEGGAPDASITSELPPDAGIDPIRATWIGRYATRSALFQFDDPIRISARLLTILEITPTSAGGLELREELCLFEGGWSYLVTSQLHYVFTNTQISAPLSFDGARFDSVLAKVKIGYGPTPAGCRAGGTLPKSEAQPWITGATCDCPRSEDSPPTSLRDCRVTDQEGDGKAGATFSANVEASTIAYRTTQEESIRLSNGYRVDDRLFAERTFDDQTRMLECVIEGAVSTPDRCPPTGAPKACPTTHNKVEMVKLEAGRTCSDVIAMEPGRFRTPLPPYPASCPAELAAMSVRPRPATSTTP